MIGEPSLLCRDREFYVATENLRKSVTTEKFCVVTGLEGWGSRARSDRVPSARDCMHSERALCT